MTGDDSKLTTDIDYDEFLRQIGEAIEKSHLRKERPWVYDIVRVLWGHRSSQGMRIEVLARELWHLREPSGLNVPKEFGKTVQSVLNQHTSQSSVWAGLGARSEDDLFYSPQGKRSGTWAVHRDRAAAWLKAHQLPDV